MSSRLPALARADPRLCQFIEAEDQRQQNHIELIASENYVSAAILEALGTSLTNKYAEGYPGKRYYGGCERVDQVENLAIERACQLFRCGYANVQPHSGSQANQAAFLAFLKPGDTILSLSLSSGGHLTHGSPVNMSGKWFKSVHYGLDSTTHRINMADVARLAQEVRPQMIIAGASAYPRQIDFAAFRQIADRVGAILLVDMAHIAGLVAAGLHPSPFPHAHVVTTTTHKTLRGPRGGMMLSDDPEIARKLDHALFPGIQGGPLCHVIAAKAVCFGEALTPEFHTYGAQVIEGAQTLGARLLSHGLDLVTGGATGGTDNHMILVDLTRTGLTGREAEAALEEVGLVCNKNTIPNDPRGPRETSGIRLGSAASTTRGFQKADFEEVADLIALRLNQLKSAPEQPVDETLKQRVQALCDRYPLNP